MIINRYFTWATLLALFGATVMVDETRRILINFTEADAAKEWMNVNDGVVGGVSEGEFKITEQKTLEFVGKLSLENNGGFASVRTRPKGLGLARGIVKLQKRS